MRRSQSVLIAACIFALAAFSPTPTEAAPATIGDNKPLIACLEDRERPLAVLFLVDTSESLQKSDYEPPLKRVQALQGAIKALDVVASDRDVSVEFMEFGSVAKLSFTDELDRWSKVKGQKEYLIKLVGEYGDRNEAEDTDYADALQAAIAEVENADERACKLVIWFTDGGLDIDFKKESGKKTLSWRDPPDNEVKSEAEEERFEGLAIDAICAKDGFADQLRGTTGDVVGDGVFLAAVAFGNPTDAFGKPTELDISLLERITTDRDGDCGERDPLGTVVLTEDLDSLTTGLIRGVDPAALGASFNGAAAIDSPQCDLALDTSNPGAFRIPSSVTEVRMRTEVPGPEVVPFLLAPASAGENSDRFDLSTAGPLKLTNGAQLNATVLSPQLTVFSLSFPDKVGSWAGDWELRFCSTNGELVGANGTIEVLSVVGALEPYLDPETKLVRGTINEAVVQLVSAESTERYADALGSGEAIFLPSSNAAAFESGGVESDGTVRLKIDLPESFESDAFAIEASLKPIVEVFPRGYEWHLTPWSGELATLEVSDPPKFPSVEEPSPFEPLDQKHLERTATIKVKAVGAESGGCVTLVVADIKAPEGSTESYELRVFDNNKEILRGKECSIELAADTERSLTVRVSLDSDAARVDTNLTGDLRFKSTSEKDPNQFDDNISRPFRVRVDPLLITENPDSEDVLLLVLAALLAPMALLYLYNLVLGARFDVISTQVATIPVVLADGRLMRMSDDGQPEPLKVFETDLTPWPHEEGRERRVKIREAIELSARISPLPWGQPRGTATMSGASIQFGELGADRGFQRARTPLTTSGFWLYAGENISEEPSPNPELLDSDLPNRSCAGALIILPGRGRELERANEILQHAAETTETTLLGNDVPVTLLADTANGAEIKVGEAVAGQDWDAQASSTKRVEDNWGTTDAGRSSASPPDADDDLPY